MGFKRNYWNFEIKSQNTKNDQLNKPIILKGSALGNELQSNAI